MIKTTTCCGLREFSGIQKTPEETLRRFCDNMKYSGYDSAVFIFSGNKRQCMVELLFFIRRNRLGRVVSTRWVKNPNSNNKIKVILFEPNKKRLKEWYRKSYSLETFPRVPEHRSFVMTDFYKIDNNYILLCVVILLFSICPTLIFNRCLYLFL